MARDAGKHALPIPWQRQYLDRREQLLDQIVTDLVGLQVTHEPGPTIALATRMPNFDHAKLKEAMSTGRFVWMAAMRGTKFVLHYSYVGASIAAFSKLAEKLTWQGLKSMGVNRDYVEAAIVPVYEYLKTKLTPVTSRQVRNEVPMKESDNALFILAARGEVVRCGRRGIYALRSIWLPKPCKIPSEADAIEKFVSAYLRSYGPAMEDDVVWWMGLPKEPIIKALRRVGRQRDDKAWDIHNPPKDDGPAPGDLRLLPGFDPLTMAWRDRSRIINEPAHKLVYKPQGAVPAIFWGGKVVGAWDLKGNIRVSSDFKGSKSEITEEIQRLRRVLKR